MKIFEYDGYPAVFLNDVMEKPPIQFKECDTHKGLLFASERCPVCVIIKERDEALGRVAELEFELQEIQDPL